MYVIFICCFYSGMKIFEYKTLTFLWVTEFWKKYLLLIMLYIDLRPGRAVKIGNAPV